MICPTCNGVKILIDRFDHSKSYTCVHCRGKGKVPDSIFSEGIIKTFDLADLVGKTLTVESHAEDGWELIVAVDIEDGVRYVLRHNKQINATKPAREDL